MKSLAKCGNLKGKKTNHSARKTMITTLAKDNIPETQIIQLSGHHNLHSLNSYKKASLQQQKEMSHILSSCTVAGQQREKTTVKQVPTADPDDTATLTSCNFFQGAQFSGCTLNIGFPLQQISTHSNAVTLMPGCRKRRLAESDED